MRNIKLTLAYDGTDYVGWQRQATGISIQGLIEQAVARIEGYPVNVFGAGRTDAGVHAAGQVTSLHLEHAIRCDALVRALNSNLPEDVRVLKAEEASETFHARYSALSKTYRYRFDTSAVVDPFERRYAVHVGERLDIDRMRQAAAALHGSHDFAAFQATGSTTSSAGPTILSTELFCEDDSAGPGTILAFDIAATGFLRHMVRIIVGTLLEVGRGRRDPSSIQRALASGDRSAAGQTAPPHGLFLRRVQY